MMSRIRRALLCAGVALLLPLAGQAHAAPPTPADGAALRKVLEDSAVAWSRGDLDGFMASYENSPDTAFVTAKGVRRGWATMRERYRKTYGEGTALGALTFSDFQATALGPDYAILYGRFHLLQPGKTQEATGVFDLVMHRTSAGWRILSDHTS